MTIKSGNKKGKRPRITIADKTATVPNDGMNTPVRDHTDAHIHTESEKALYKQAENPLGNPDRE